jgi:L-lactate dehydrogenase (cytochrome)
MNLREITELLDLTSPPRWGRSQRLAACRNVEDLRRAFARGVPRAVADFVEGGAEDEVTLRRNREAFERVRLIPAQLRGVPDVDLSTDLFGRRVRMPLGLSPTGVIRVVHPDGELAVARAALIYAVPCMGSVLLEDVAAAVPPDATLWFHLPNGWHTLQKFDRV